MTAYPRKPRLSVVSKPAGPCEESIMRGLCPDCGGPMKVWTWPEIHDAKEDIGMGAEDDFFDCCPECMKAFYIPKDGKWGL